MALTAESGPSRNSRSTSRSPWSSSPKGRWKPIGPRSRTSNCNCKYCHIIAPISGTIGLRLVDPGNIVKANDLTGMAVITQLQPITVVFTIPQDDIARVQRASQRRRRR